VGPPSPGNGRYCLVFPLLFWRPGIRRYEISYISPLFFLFFFREIWHKEWILFFLGPYNGLPSTFHLRQVPPSFLPRRQRTVTILDTPMEVLHSLLVLFRVHEPFFYRPRAHPGEPRRDSPFLAPLIKRGRSPFHVLAAYKAADLFPFHPQ